MCVGGGKQLVALKGQTRIVHADRWATNQQITLPQNKQLIRKVASEAQDRVG